jgi:ABC-type glycerol-3-phosphate transport system permease component
MNEPGPLTRALLLVATVIVAAIAAIPILWGVVTALKVPAQILTYPPQWIPSPPTLHNITQAWQHSNLPIYFRNSVMLSAISVILSVVLAAHAGYALARFQFRGQALIMVGLLATSMIPGIAILVPLYELAVRTELYNTFAGLTLVYTSRNVPILVWLLKGFFESVPLELEEAAMVDGCSRWRAFYQIVLPMARPGLLSGEVMALMFTRNDFLIAFALTISDERRLLSVGLYTYISTYGIDWGLLMAATVIALLPVVVVFFVLQRRFVDGLMAGAVKG